MDEKSLRDTLLSVIESSLDAQLRAVRRLRTCSAEIGSRDADPKKASDKGRSQVDMAYDILIVSGPLHVTELLSAIKLRFGIEIDRESLVSALSKRIARGDRFERTDRNTFGVISSAES